MLRTLLLLLVAAPLALAAPVPKELKRTDEDAIVGTWQVVRYSVYNENRVLPATLWRFDGEGKGQFWNSMSRHEMAYTLLPPASAESPNGFDYSWDHFKMKGLYRLDGDTLTIALNNDGGKVRAAELAPGKNTWYWEFKRVHPEAK
jgi:hypothetical protein